MWLKIGKFLSETQSLDTMSVKGLGDYVMSNMWSIYEGGSKDYWYVAEYTKMDSILTHWGLIKWLMTF